VGIVGAGYVSAYHVRALRTLPDVHIVGVVDTDAARARKLADRFSIPEAYPTLAAMGGAQPDVVHVLTPPDTHCRLAVEALRMHCDVLVEKPMAPTVPECDEMIDAAKRAGKILSVNHSAKVDPIVLHGLDLLERGACGDVLSVDFLRSSDYPLYAGGPLPAAFRNGGYPFEDLGLHALCLMEAFLGAIHDVHVDYRSTGKHPNVFFDEWRGTVGCEKGRGGFLLSWSTRPLRNELFIQGTRGSMHIDCFLQACRVSKPLPGPKAITSSLDAAANAAGTLYKVPRNMVRFLTGTLRPSPGIHAGVVQFYATRKRAEPPPVTMEEGRRIVSWLDPVCRRADADRDKAFRVQRSPAPARILITGAAGLLGRALLARLNSQGEKIRVLVRRPSPELEASPNVDVVYGDLGDAETVDRATRGVDLVYHLGAAMRGRGWADFQAGTVSGTANIVRSCLDHRIKRLVYVSSLTVLDYASLQQGALIAEDAPLEQRMEERGAYTQSKLKAEMLVRDAVRERGLPAVVLRPGQIFGPGAESIPPYGTIAIAGWWIVIGSGAVKLPLVYVEDVVDGLIAGGTRPGIEGSLFHLVDGSPVTQRDYIAICRTASATPVPVAYVPRSVLFAAGWALEVIGRLLRRGLPMSRHRVRSIKELRFDCTAARNQLAWQPTVGVQRGLAQSFRERTCPTPALAVD
jgi:2-alkyl-3-oxoalkanoate reductase